MRLISHHPCLVIATLCNLNWGISTAPWNDFQPHPFGPPKKIFIVSDPGTDVTVIGREEASLIASGSCAFLSNPETHKPWRFFYEKIRDLFLGAPVLVKNVMTRVESWWPHLDRMVTWAIWDGELILSSKEAASPFTLPKFNIKSPWKIGLQAPKRKGSSSKCHL